MTIPDVDPMCGWCNRPRLEDIDPTTTVFLCKPHQAMADRMHDDLARILVPRDQLVLPAGSERFGIISTVPVDAEPADKLDVAAMVELMDKLTQQRRNAGLEMELYFELISMIGPTSPMEMALRLGAIARHHFDNRFISSQHTSWRVCLLSDRGGILMVRDCPRPHQAEEIGERENGKNGVAGYRIERQEHEAYSDGSTYTGPWITVTNTLEPTTEETPCTTTRSD